MTVSPDDPGLDWKLGSKPVQDLGLSMYPVLLSHQCKILPILLIGCLGTSTTGDCEGRVRDKYKRSARQRDECADKV